MSEPLSPTTIAERLRRLAEPERNQKRPEQLRWGPVRARELGKRREAPQGGDGAD